jgi:hypothetical protein
MTLFLYQYIDIVCSKRERICLYNFYVAFYLSCFYGQHCSKVRGAWANDIGVRVAVLASCQISPHDWHSILSLILTKKNNISSFQKDENKLVTQISKSYLCVCVYIVQSNPTHGLCPEWFLLLLFLQYWGLNSGPTPWATPPALFCVMGFFEKGSCKLFVQAHFEQWSSFSLSPE